MIISAIFLFAALIVAWFLLPATPAETPADNAIVTVAQVSQQPVHKR